jgi:hypothetical protein
MGAMTTASPRRSSRKYSALRCGVWVRVPHLPVSSNTRKLAVFRKVHPGCPEVSSRSDESQNPSSSGRGTIGRVQAGIKRSKAALECRISAGVR